MQTRLGPERALARILDDFKGLDQLYIGVLEDAMRHYEREEAPYEEELNSEFRQILGCIVVLLDVVSVMPLARLCNMDPTSVFVTLDSLRAILEVPKTPSDVNSIRLHHPSFRDFLLDPKDAQILGSRWTKRRRMGIYFPIVSTLCRSSRKTYAIFSIQGL